MRAAGFFLLVTALLSWVFQAQGWSVPVFKVYGLLDSDQSWSLAWSTVLSALTVIFGLDLVGKKHRLAGRIMALVGALFFLTALFGLNPLATWLDGKLGLLKMPGATTGHVLRLLACAGGVFLLLRPAGPVNPLTLKRWKRFRAIRRGYISLWLLILLTVLALLDNVVIGKRALAVKHNGEWSFPFLRENPIPGKTYGLATEAETDYRELRRVFAAQKKGDVVILPLVPYSARLDTPSQSRAISKSADGKLYDDARKRAFTGTAFTVFTDKPMQHRREYRVRDGVFHGTASGYDAEGAMVERLEYADGKLTRDDKLNPETDFAALTARESADFRQVLYPPVAPVWKERHFLGTDSSGTDILALLYAGFQLQWAAAFFYTAFVFAMGIVIGCASGYFGGVTDLVTQRLVEIWSALPFLLVIILIRSTLTPGIVALVFVIALFTWMPLTYYLRGGTYAEKSRDYVSAARLLGAGDSRIIFRHILPNIMSTLITKLPFTFEALIASLTALDFLGFGLPPGEPSWGALLKDGTDNMQAPWILYSAFAAVVIVLTLITFVGEAVREAFDPKKFTVYR